MSVAWNSTKRHNIYSNWKCSEKESANSCPSGYKGDPEQHQSSKKCNDDANCGSNVEGGCPISCSGDTRSRSGSCTPMYNRERALCFKNDYGTTDNDKANCCSGLPTTKTTPPIYLFGQLTSPSKTIATYSLPETCHVDYYKGGNTCQDWMQSYCSIDKRVLNDPRCKKWCGDNEALCDNVKKSVCVGSDLTSSVCQAWCARNKSDCDAEYRNYCTSAGFNENGSLCNTKAIEIGGMDDAVQQFCASHIDSEFCACYKSINQVSTQTNESLKAILARPECYIAKCSSGGGYKTTNMRQSNTCPPVNVCQNTLNALGNSSTGLIGINQSCDQQQNNTTAPAPAPPSANSSIFSNPLMIFIFLIVILAGIFGYQFIFTTNAKINANR